MSIAAINAVLAHSKAKGSDRLVLLILATHANDETFECYPGHVLLGQEAAMSERNLIYCLKRLEDLGEIGINRGLGRGNLTVYQIHLARVKTAEKLQATASFNALEKVQDSAIKVQVIAPFPAENLQPSASFIEPEKVQDSVEKVQDSVIKGAKVPVAYKDIEPSGTMKKPGSARAHENLPFASESPEMGAITSGEQIPKETQGAPAPFEVFKRRFPDQATIHAEEVITAAGISILAIWETTLDAWKTNCYSARNIAGMIENYRDRAKRAERQPASGQPRGAPESTNWRDYAPQPRQGLPNKARTLTSSFSMDDFKARRAQRPPEPQPVDTINDLEIPF